MKKMISFVILFFLLAKDISAANMTDTLPVVDSAAVGLLYKAKAKRQSTAGTILFAAGGVMASVGLGLALASLNHLFEPGYQTKDYGSLPDVLGYGGLALIVAGIPFFIASKKTRRTAKIFLRNQKPPSLQTVTGIKRQTSAGIIINF